MQSVVEIYICIFGKGRKLAAADVQDLMIAGVRYATVSVSKSVQKSLIEEFV
jgi:hypothetical protein